MNDEAIVPEAPPGFVTVTSTAPGAWGGAIATRLPDERTVTDGAATPPNETAGGVGPVEKLAPRIVTAVPPAGGPLAGESPDRIGRRRARSTAALTSRLPQPKTLFGLTPATEPHSVVLIPTAESARILSVWATCPTRAGWADQRRATARRRAGRPSTSPRATRSPLRERSNGWPFRAQRYPASFVRSRRDVTGPRLLKEAIDVVPVWSAPTTQLSPKMAGGSETVEQPEPEFPAETDVKIPAARWAATASLSVSAPHPSKAGQPHELFVTCGAFDRSPCATVPPTGYGARKKSKHSR